jgi:hypothetical protein
MEIKSKFEVVRTLLKLTLASGAFSVAGFSWTTGSEILLQKKRYFDLKKSIMRDYRSHWLE